MFGSLRSGGCYILDSPPSPGGSPHSAGESSPGAALAASSFDSVSALAGFEVVRTLPLHPPLFDSLPAPAASPSPHSRLSAFDPALAVLSPTWLVPVAPVTPAEGLSLDLPACLPGVAQDHVRDSPPGGCISLDSPQSPAGSAHAAGGSPPRAALAAPSIDDGAPAAAPGLDVMRLLPLRSPFSDLSAVSAPPPCALPRADLPLRQLWGTAELC